jgi:hypothetical protein
MKRLPLYDADAPIVCSIGASDVPERIELVERLRSALLRLDRTEHGMLLHFPNDPAVEDDLRRFVIDETSCCRFWGFAVEVEPDALRLRWDGPPTAEDVIEELVTFFSGSGPFTPVFGLL